jgi:hypothetical protein
MIDSSKALAKPLPNRLPNSFARLILALVIGLAALPATARAQAPAPPSTAARQEAAERFDRGVRLFNQGDNAGALVEFKRAYELTSDPLLLFNIGLVYAEQKRPIDAVDALDRLLASSARLSPEQRTKAERVRAEQAAFIAFLEVTTSVPAVIDLDGVEIGHTPLAARLRIPAGTHQVGAVAAGYAPSHKTIDIAGGETQKLAFDLIPGEVALGHVGIRTSLPGAEVYIDGKPVPDKTPLRSTLALTPGDHQIELRRDGYFPASQRVHIDLGSVAEIQLQPEMDRLAAERAGGKLRVEASEPEAVVSVDGAPAVSAAEPLALPPGPHHLLVTRAGFESAEQDASVQAGATTTADVRLRPTLETRQAYLGRIHERRLWGWSVAVAGAAATVTGAVLVITGRGALDDANANLATVQRSMIRFGGGTCDPATIIDPNACQAALDDANNRVDSAKLRMTIGYITGGVGVAGVVVGTVLVLTGDDPHRYDEVPGLARGGLSGWTSGNGGGVIYTGRF